MRLFLLFVILILFIHLTPQEVFSACSEESNYSYRKIDCPKDCKNCEECYTLKCIDEHFKSWKEDSCKKVKGFYACDSLKGQTFESIIHASDQACCKKP